MKLDTNQVHRAQIMPVDGSVSRPLWSVMIPTYNCADYLRQALTSVLAQDPGPETMQIQVVDDCSTQDDPESVVLELGKGRVEFYRQSHNQGYIKNFKTCLQRSRGHLIHLLHGDDYVLSNFYQKMQQGFDSNPMVGAAFCRHLYLDEVKQTRIPSAMEADKSGVLEDWLEKIAGGQRVATPSIVVRRAVYEKLGGFDDRFTCAGEDWEMWVRIAAHYPVWFEPEILAVYRVTRAGSLTASASRNFRLVQDMRYAVEIIETYLPEYLPQAKARQSLNKSRNMYALWSLEGAQTSLGQNNFEIASSQIKEALKCSRSASIWRTGFRLNMLLLWGKLRKFSTLW